MNLYSSAVSGSEKHGKEGVEISEIYLLPHTCLDSSISKSHLSGTFVTTDALTPTHRFKPESTVGSRAHT